jgi:hypothetical protein
MSDDDIAGVPKGLERGQHLTSYPVKSDHTTSSVLGLLHTIGRALTLKSSGVMFWTSPVSQQRKNHAFRFTSLP